MEHAVNMGANMAAGLEANSKSDYGVSFKNTYKFECFDKDGNLKWTEEVHNIVVNAGLNDLLTQYFKGSAYTASFFVGLKNTGTPVAADTMASHGSWTENATYSNATRPALTLGSVASQSVDNSASKAVFNINGSTTIFGAFVTTNSTVSGTTGTLYGAADFGASRAVVNGDTLNVTVTLTAS
jgi:hypothetical protein